MIESEQLAVHPLGKHFLLDLRNCRRNILDDLDFLRDALLSVAQQTGSEVVSESFHRFDPQGVSGVVLVAGSHFGIHTWPEHGYAAIDIFTYTDTFQPEVATRALIEKLQCGESSVIELKRGS